MENDYFLPSAEIPPSPSTSSSDDDHTQDSHHLSSTSPSSESSHSSPRSISLKGQTKSSSEASVFFSDLSNYIPLGCLCFKDNEVLGHEYRPEVWASATQIPRISGFDEILDGHLQRLILAGWVRLESGRSKADPRFVIYRVYILPFDIGHRFVDRTNKRLLFALESLVSEVDISTDSWNGKFTSEGATKFDLWATNDEGSLFWMFNKIPSPSPRIDNLKEKYTREALEDLLDPTSSLPGLKSQLYPYQRRSAGLMLQRETVPSLDLDPRLERRIAPDGSTFYYGARDFVFFRHPRYYEACKGGILAETMGLGKTVMCLALILATKDHLPLVPPEYGTPPVRPSIASLADMAVSAINRKSVPYRVEFERIRHATGNDMRSCRDRLEENPPCYEIPIIPQRWNRTTVSPPPKKMRLAATTLIVVPRNLCKQWQLEIRKHVEEGALRLLVMEDRKKALPDPNELRTFDIVLFTRGRFEAEIRDGSDDQGRRMGTTQLLCRCPYIKATRTRDCTCLRTDDLYDSPLKHLHFKRLIIDEGHFFSNTNTAAVSVANKLITADHRWVVSGTPAKDLLGVEVDMSAAENLWHTPNTKDSRDSVLEQRRHFSKKDDTEGAIKSIGALASNFLRIKPWSNEDVSEKKADWEEYIYRHESLRRRTFSGFSTCLRRALESIVLRTRPEDVEKDIDLPPLSHEVIRLEPSFYDKLTANLFTIVLTANAVTSERTDQDYLWHKNSHKARSQLIANLRQSAFFWTGFSEADVLASVKSSNAYLAKDGTGCTESDRELLKSTLACTDVFLESVGWKSLSRSHELGLFVEDWPEESAEQWTFDESCNPLLTGLSQLLEAQKYVNQRVYQDDQGEGLAGAGIHATSSARHVSLKKENDDKEKLVKPILTKLGIPTSSIDGEPILRRRGSSIGKGTRVSPTKSPKPAKVSKSEKKRRQRKRNSADERTASVSIVSDDHSGPSPSNLTATNDDSDEIPFTEDSPFLRSRIVGTTSSKLSYLISQILKHYRHEKILVFYDGDNAAYYIAQMLELLHIKHEIYAKSLAASLKSEYVVRFDQETQDRVLLMDVRNAAFGLNLPSASRIFFVNPVCRPNVEAQAIKRAHRIGQRKMVHVETLVLKDTIEEKMLERSKRMTRSEHHDAKALEDDGGIREIIQSAKMLPVREDEKHGHGQMAALEEPQQVWGRSGWQKFSGPPLAKTEPTPKKRKVVGPDEDAIDTDDIEMPSGKRVRHLDFVDLAEPPTCQTEDSDDEPILSKWRRSCEGVFDSPCETLATSTAGDHPSSAKQNSNRVRAEALIAQACHNINSNSQRARLSISSLLNNEPRTNPQIQTTTHNLLQEILRRL